MSAKHNPTKLTILPHLSSIKKGHKTTLDVLIALEAEEKKHTRNAPSLNLAIAIDNSGSMAGHPLEQAKKAVAALIHNLKNEDRVSIITYSDTARVVMESMLVKQAKTVVDQLLMLVKPEGMTALHAGWLTGAQQVAPFVSQYDVSRVMLLSDGQANIGETSLEALSEAGKKLALAGITTSTYGIGNSFNETLMTAISQAGQGMAFYAENADGLATYFHNEFAMLNDLAGKNIRLKVKAIDNLGNLINGSCLNSTASGDDGNIALPMLLAGSETWAVVSFDISEDQTNGEITLLVEGKFTDSEGSEHQIAAETQVKTGARNGKTNQRVVERAKEVRAANMAREAAEAAIRGDMATSAHLIRGISSMAGNNAYITAVAMSLSAAADGDQARFAKEAMYSSTTMSSRVAEKNEDATVLAAGKYGLRRGVQGKAEKGTQEAK